MVARASLALAVLGSRSPAPPCPGSRRVRAACEIRGQIDDMLTRSAMAPPPSPQATCGTVVTGQEKNWAAPAPWQRVFSHNPAEWPWLRQYPPGTSFRFCQYTARVTGTQPEIAYLAEAVTLNPTPAQLASWMASALPNGDRAEQGAGRPLRPVRARALLGPAAAGAGKSQAMAGHPPGFGRAIRRCRRSHAGHQPGWRDLLSRWRRGSAAAARPAVDRLFRPHRGARRAGRKAGERRASWRSASRSPRRRNGPAARRRSPPRPATSSGRRCPGSACRRRSSA